MQTEAERVFIDVITANPLVLVSEDNDEILSGAQDILADKATGIRVGQRWIDEFADFFFDSQQFPTGTWNDVSFEELTPKTLRDWLKSYMGVPILELAEDIGPNSTLYSVLVMYYKDLEGSE